MIEAGAVIQMLLDACPSYATRWNEHAAEPDFDESLLYVHLGDFAAHVVNLFRGGEIEAIRTACSAIERLHVEGTPDVQEAATIGLLEGLQHHASHAGLAVDFLEPFLGPESMRWWRGLNAFWEGRAPFVRATDDAG